MGHQVDIDRLNREAKAFLERDRLPERRMQSVSHVIFRPSYCEPWPGDGKPVGIERNPFLRQSWNITLASVILTDPDRQQEAFDKLLEAGTLAEKALDLLSAIHGESLSVRA